MAFHGGGYFGRKTQVQSWDIIRKDLLSEFVASPVIFQEVLTLSSDYIRGENQPGTGEELLLRLENNLIGKDLFLDFLIAVMEHMSFRTDMGTVEVAAVLRSHKEKLEEYRRTEMDDERESENFVGRNKYISDIVELFNDDRNLYKGVCICGMGGMGKTTLANQICTAMKRRWKIIKVDLKEVTTLLDVLREIFVKLGCQKWIGESEEDILQQIEDFLEEGDIIKQRSILVLDNIDDVINGEGSEKFSAGFLKTFGSFLRDFGVDCKMRLLLTSRVKVSSSKGRRQPSRQDSGFGVVLEKVLDPLTSSEAVELFSKSIDKKEIETAMIEKIVKLCGYSPLAITTLCSSIRFQLLNPYTILEDLKTNSRLGPIAGTSAVTVCLDKTFESLNKRDQGYLVRLAVFHTATFDLEAAAAVLGKTERSGTFRGDKTMLKILNLRSRHLLEVSETVQSKSDEKYSLHPMVYHLLKRKVQSGLFARDFDVANNNFVQHFRKVICKVGEEMEKNCLKGQKLLGNDRVHVMNFYETLAGRDAFKTTDNLQTIVQSKRIYEVAEELLYDDTKRRLIQNFIEKTRDKDGNQLEYIFWRICEATMLLDMDRNQETKKIIDHIESVFTTLRGPEMTMAAVIGNFYYMKGRYYLREYRCEESIRSLRQATNLIRIREVKKDHQGLLAKIFNVMGAAYFREDETNFAKPREYHEAALRTIIKCSPKLFNIEVPVYIHNLAAILFREGEALRKMGQEGEARSHYQMAIQYYDNGLRLNIQMNLHKQDSHAQILQNRGEAYAALGIFDKAETDVEEAMVLRQKLMSPPHIQLTLVTYKMAKVLYQKGIWLYHRGELLPAINTMLRGMTQCEEVVNHVTCGGMPYSHKVFPEMKELILKVLVTVQEWKKLGKLLKKVQKFEQGGFQKQIDKRRSLKETTKQRLTQKELYAIINSRTATIQLPARQGSDDEDSLDFSSDSDDAMMDDTEIKEKIPANLFSEREAAVDFTSIIDGSYFKMKQEERVPSPERTSDIPYVAELMHVDEDDDDDGTPVTMSEKNVHFDDMVSSENQVGKAEQSSANTGTEESVRRPLIKRQSSSLEMEVFGRPELLSQHSEDMPEEMRILRDNVMDKSAEKRQAWQATSLESASLEYTRDQGGIVSLNEQLAKVDISINKRGLLLKMRGADAILEEEDTLPEVHESEQTAEETMPRKPRMKRQSGVSEDVPIPDGKRRYQHDS